VQILHRGPYADETPSVEAMRAFVDRKGLEFAGAHHEIYLGDPNRAAQEKLKTVLRYAVGPKK
jgi:hypothetical protein